VKHAFLLIPTSLLWIWRHCNLWRS